MADGGARWTSVPLPLAGNPRTLVSGKNSLFLSTDTHIWQLSAANGSMEDRSKGIEPFQVRGLWATDSRLFAATDDGYLSQWSVAEGLWKRETGIDGIPFGIAGAGPVMLLSTSSTTYVTLDGGKFWESRGFFSLQGETLRSLTVGGDYVFGGDGHGGLWKYSTKLPNPPVSLGDATSSNPKRSRFRLQGPEAVLRAQGLRPDGKRAGSPSLPD